MNLNIIILAAGEGKRMKSTTPKVLHAVGGRPMLGHVLACAEALKASDVAVVVGPNARSVSDYATVQLPAAEIFVQDQRLGTGHATMSARPLLERANNPTIVVFADNPLLRPETLSKMISRLDSGAAVCVLGFETDAPTGYGRLLMDGDELIAIREEKDAAEDEKAVTLCNSGAMAFSAGVLPELLGELSNDNAQGEYYLTDCVEIGRRKSYSVQAVISDFSDAAGVNSRGQLAEVEGLFQSRVRGEMMENGVTLIAPETVFFTHDTDIESDVVVEPHVIFGPGVSVAQGAEIKGFSHIEGASIGTNAIIGPFARLRPGADLSEGVKVGNFVEVKGAKIGEGSKINHLTYIGDAEIGASVNVGAGTVTCNYDGYLKHKTGIGDGVFVGSGSLLVAPLTVEPNAYIATGSVITEDVPEGALAFGRARQVNKDGRGMALKEKLAAEKARKSKK